MPALFHRAIRARPAPRRRNAPDLGAAKNALQARPQSRSPVAVHPGRDECRRRPCVGVDHAAPDCARRCAQSGRTMRTDWSRGRSRRAFAAQSLRILATHPPPRCGHSKFRPRCTRTHRRSPESVRRTHRARVIVLAIWIVSPNPSAPRAPPLPFLGLGAARSRMSRFAARPATYFVFFLHERQCEPTSIQWRADKKPAPGWGRPGRFHITLC